MMMKKTHVEGENLYKISKCTGCNEPLNAELKWNDNYTSMHEYMCKKCTKRFTKSFINLEKDMNVLIERNPIINRKLDLIIKQEPLWNFTKEGSQYSTIYLREFMFSLLEEIHVFIYQAAFEIILYVKNFNTADETFFSDRYFLNNSVIKTIAAWEKLMMFYSLQCEANIQPLNKINTLDTMKKSLRKTDFKATKTHSHFQTVMSNGSFKKIDEARKYNDHNLSYHLGKNLSEMLEVAEAVATNLKLLYPSLEEAIDLFENKARVCDEKFLESYIPKFKIEVNDKVFKKKVSKFNFDKINTNITNINQISIRYILEMELRINEASKWKIQYSNPPLNRIYYRLFDVTMRIHEAVRSLGYALQMYTDACRLGFDLPLQYEIHFPGMNYRYFIHNALIRVYACYDKIGVIMKELFEIDNINYNSSLEKIIKHLSFHNDEELNFINSLPPIKIINYTLSNKYYKKIYNHRQDFFHNLTKSNFIIKSYVAVLDLELIDTIISNSRMIYDIIDSLDVSIQSFHMIGMYHDQN